MIILRRTRILLALTLAGSLLSVHCPMAQEASSFWQKARTYYTASDWRMSDTLQVRHRQLLFGISLGGLRDTYLSPIAHRGSSVSLLGATDYPSSPSFPHLYGEWYLEAGQLENPANRSLLQVLSGKYALGCLWRPLSARRFALDLGVAGSTQVASFAKLSNVNNVFNAHVSAGADALARVLCRLPFSWCPATIHFTTSAEVCHVAFSPLFGQSYYDYVSGENRGRIALHVSHPLNKLALTSRLVLDIPFRGVTLSLGGMHCYFSDRSPANPYHKGSIGFLIGLSYDAFTLAGYQRMRTSTLTNTFDL